MRARAEAKGLAADIAIADDLPERVIGDPVWLRAALENLIDNAVKFTERGRVALAVGAASAGKRHRLTFTVSDSGIGLTRHEIARLFRPFRQASASVARRYGGSGLGLAFVRRLAIELVNAEETETIVADRAARRAWLEQRDYRVVQMKVTDVEADLDSQLERLQESLSNATKP